MLVVQHLAKVQMLVLLGAAPRPALGDPGRNQGSCWSCGKCITARGCQR